MRFSVLMSIYKGEKPEYLKMSLDSVLNQTLLPNEIVLVEDGPLTEALYSVIDSYVAKCPLIKVVPFPQNRGLGLALRDGVLECNYEWIARMDTDDVCRLDRFEKQVNFIKNNPEISVLGSWITEFSEDPTKPNTITKLPVTHEDIIAFAKVRNPFRHVTMFMKKSAVLDAGNYGDFLLFEDYDLFVRLLVHGNKSANIPEVLVDVRADDEMFARRGGFGYVKKELRFQKFIRDINFISNYEFVRNVLMRIFVRIVPNKLRVLFYKHFLRSES